MGTKPRHVPIRLAEKLLAIRSALGLSQSQLLRRLEAGEDLTYQRISEFETGKREPPLWIVLAYARVAAVHMEDIVDDELELPKTLPGSVRYKGTKRKDSTKKFKHS
jgi:transcriptional regulator with XRE-family HTH domain